MSSYPEPDEYIRQPLTYFFKLFSLLWDNVIVSCILAGCLDILPFGSRVVEYKSSEISAYVHCLHFKCPAI